MAEVSLQLKQTMTSDSSGSALITEHTALLGTGTPPPALSPCVQTASFCALHHILAASTASAPLTEAAG